MTVYEVTRLEVRTNSSMKSTREKILKTEAEGASERKRVKGKVTIQIRLRNVGMIQQKGETRDRNGSKDLTKFKTMKIPTYKDKEKTKTKEDIPKLSSKLQSNSHTVETISANLSKMKNKNRMSMLDKDAKPEFD
ncbi:hypothetical protein BDR06DRAFT_972290 [Suillus hirtellus]|nr:hypothetical protein BDR06DRAFT_972290 [Suillus hirtellus]